MSKEEVLIVDNLSKQYRLGVVGTGTLSHDLNRWWHRVRGKDDPYLKLGDTNDREQKGGEYVWALKDIDLSIKEGEVLGIIGKNGAGKSTLLKILSQVTTPTRGQVKIKGRIASLLEVGTGFHPELTGRENIFLNGAILGMKKPEIRAKLDEIIEFSGCAKYVDTPIKRYSSGMMVRLGFAVAAHLEPEILVVDEVLAVGDADFQKKCIGKMKDVSREGRTILFVSHNMASVRNLCSRGIVMDKGQVVFRGNVEESISKYLTLNNNIETKVTTNIPESTSLYNTGNAKFKEVKIFNDTEKVTNEFHFREKIKVVLTVQVSKDMENMTFILGVVSKFGEIVAFGISKNETFEVENLTKGTYEVEFVLPADLMPGDYALSFGLTNFYTGESMDYVEYFYPFNISKETKDHKLEYPWQTINGYVELKNNWTIKKIK